MLPAVSDLDFVYPAEYYTVLLDGRVIGYVPPNIAEDFVNSLRYLKIT